MKYLLNNPWVLIIIISALYSLYSSGKKKKTPNAANTPKPVNRSAPPRAQVRPSDSGSGFDGNLSSLIRSLETSLKSASTVQPEQPQPQTMTLLDQRRLRQAQEAAAAAAQEQSADFEKRGELGDVYSSTTTDFDGGIDYDKDASAFDQGTVDFDDQQQNFQYQSAGNNVQAYLQQAVRATETPRSPSTGTAPEFSGLFSDPESMRLGILYNEILGKPKSMRR